MFTDKVELKDFEKQDPEYQDLLRRVLAIQADCEIGGPNWHVDILPNAPSWISSSYPRRRRDGPYRKNGLFGW
jgi:hypothetical protein